MESLHEEEKCGRKKWTSRRDHCRLDCQERLIQELGRSSQCSEVAVTTHRHPRRRTGNCCTPHIKPFLGWQLKHLQHILPSADHLMLLLCSMGQLTPLTWIRERIGGDLSTGRWQTPHNTDQLKATIKATFASRTPQQCKKMITCYLCIKLFKGHRTEWGVWEVHPGDVTETKTLSVQPDSTILSGSFYE